MWLLYVVGAVAVVVLVELLLTGDTPRLHGVYAQPGRWYHFKRLFAYVILSVRQRRKQKAAPRSHPTGYGPDACAVERLEQPRPLAKNPRASDSIYINGMNHAGTTFVLRVDRRPDRKCDVWMALLNPDVGCLLLPGQPDPRVYHCDGTTFSAAGVRLECLEGMRRWKVTFNGIMRRGLNRALKGDQHDLIHVRFSFIWEAFSDVFDFDFDQDPWLLSDSVAREEWSSQLHRALQSCSEDTHYEQWGEMAGSLLVEGSDEQKMDLRGLRCREHGIKDWQSYHRYVTHTGHLKDGTAFHVSTICQPNKLSHLQAGYVCLPCGVHCPLIWSDLDLPTLGEFGHAPEKYGFHFSAGGRTYKVNVDTQTAVTFYHDDDWSTAITEKLCNFEVNGVYGSGVTRFLNRNEDVSPVNPPEVIPLLSEARLDDLPEVDQTSLTLPFTGPACTSSDLVGGKGCQLAMLTQCGNKDFIVPKGFCLTIEAFSRQLQENLRVKTEIKSIHRIASGRQEGELRGACEALVGKVQALSVCAEVREALEAQLRTMFDDWEGLRFAVRSSAAGEDGEDMSAAGQMDTILGAKGLEQILAAVTQCWASHFAFTAVEYRRQHGQVVTSSMGVVIQEMVPSQVSGVLFTQDPLTGHPGRMTINANFGLGESVVSGSAEPDSVNVAKGWDGNVSVISTTVGGKKTKIEMTTEGGTQETEVDGDSCRKCCLDDDVILRLAAIGVQLEKAFTNPRDIEWAVNEGQIYLLQARPITTLAVESEWDIMHEFDTPLASDDEVLTTANISEMMPGAVTPLSASTFVRGCDYAIIQTMQYTGVLPRLYNLQRFLGMRNYHAFINMSFVYGLSEGRVLGSNRQMTDLALLGEVLPNVPPEKIAAYWGYASWWQRLRATVLSHYNNYDSHYRTQRWGEWVKTYSFGEHRRAESLYSAIHERLPDYMECWSDTVTNSGVSAVWSSVLMATLTQGNLEWTVDHYSDVAMLLSKCEGVYSADVPSALQELSLLIRKSNRCKEFVEMSSEDAVSWLISPDSDAIYMKFQEFLSNHGHRCIREAEFRAKSWKSDPTQLVKVLQAMLKAPSTGSVQTGVEDANEAIAKVKSPLTFVGKKVLQFAVPRARRAVGGREWGKSISIEMVDVFKQAYWRLAKMMRDEGHLPDEDLLFFMTHQEIGQMLRQRPARLVAKAQKRRRLHDKLMGLQYHRLNTGHPDPIQEEDNAEEVLATAKLTGTPVSQGRTRGVARVVKSLEEAGDIQLGDILVVSYTDVGWSPYFPLISGLVTEIGGLLSHGAVVAREYGLPCIVNVPRATVLIKTGDEVIIDGTNGVLQKVSE